MSEPAKPIEGQNKVAEAVTEQLRGAMLNDPVTDEWYHRVANRFEPIPENHARLLIKKKIEKIKPSFAYGYLSGVASFVRDDLSLTGWTDDKQLLPLKNGVLNLKTQELRQYELHDRFRTCLPIEFDHRATCLQTEAILQQIANNDNDLYETLIAWMYAILHKRNDLQRFIELIGSGGTGKSTIIDLFTRLVGVNNRVVTDLKELENNRFESAGLYGKYLIVINDSERYGGEVSKLKAITGGDPIRNETKNKQQGPAFTADGIVVIAANEPVASKDYSTGMSRRRAPLYLNYRITKQDKEKYPDGVGAVFDSELAGLLNLLLRQSESEMIERIVTPADSIASGKLQAELDTNPMLSWADDHLVTVEYGKESPIGGLDDNINSYLYASYVCYCTNNGNKPVGTRRFTGLLEQQLTSYGIETSKHRNSNHRFLTGLAVRNHNHYTRPTLLTRHSMTLQ